MHWGVFANSAAHLYLPKLPQKKMSQNDWATIPPFGPVTLIFTGPNNFFRASQRLALISGTVFTQLTRHNTKS